MEKLLLKLAQLHIALEVRDGHLDIYDPNNCLTAELISDIKSHKEDILQLLGDVQEEYEFSAIPKAAEKEYYVLSSAQKRMYFLNMLDTESIAYNMPDATFLPGGVDVDRLQLTFAKLFERHEILRTTFHLIDGEPVQKVHPFVDCKIETFQCSRSEFESVINNFTRPFDLSKAPMLRLGVVEVSPQEQYLLIDMHHIISDGVSHDLMLKDFSSLYAGEELPPLHLQYKDYAEWQQSEAQQEELASQKEFWLQEFADQPEVINLPADRARPINKTLAGDVIDFRLSKEQTAQLKALAASEGATAYMLLLSLYYVLLNKLANTEDIVVGTPVAGRGHADLADILGLFVNTLPLRNEVRGTQSFLEFFQQVKGRVLQCFDNQSFQYEELIDALKVARNTSRNPLFDVFFAYENFSDEEELGRRQEMAYESEYKVAKFDLSLTAGEKDGALELTFEYSTDLFERSTIERFETYFRQIVTAVLADKTRKIKDIDVLTAAERHQLLHTFNDTKVAFPKQGSILESFEAQANLTPDRIALRHEGGQMTYADVQRISDGIAGYLLENEEVQRGAGIGIVLEREPLLIPLIYGIQKAGAAYIPIDPKNPTDRINAIIEESGLELLFSRSIYLNDQIAANCRVLNLDLLESGLVEAAPPLQHVPLQPSDLAYIIYTSGSTGKPKGVMIEHRSLSNIIHHLDRHYPLEADGNYLFKTTYAFDVSVAEIYGWFLNGGCLTILPPGAESDPYALLDVIDDYKVTHVNFVPSMFSVFVEAIKNRGVDKIRHLSYAFLAGEALPVELVRQFDGLGVNAVLENIYGPTEGTIYSAGFSTRHLPAGPRVPIGKPLSNLSLYVLDKHQNLQPLGVPGELCIGGAALARGYLNDAKLTNSKFIPHPFVEGERIYRTGDLARWLPTGDIDYLGRIDKQVKIRGFRIELGEIEHQLVAHELIREVVVAVKERAGDKYLAAYYVSEEVLGSKELTDFLIGKLPSYMLPTYFVHLDELPLKANGKLDSKRLPEPALQQQDDYLAPSSEIAQQLAGIWSDILDLDYNRIGVNHTFFELGGHSLKAISVISRIEKEFNVKIRLQTFFNKPTISDLEKNILMTFLSQKPKVNKKTSHKVII